MASHIKREEKSFHDLQTRRKPREINSGSHKGRSIKDGTLIGRKMTKKKKKKEEGYKSKSGFKNRPQRSVTSKSRNEKRPRQTLKNRQAEKKKRQVP